MPGVLRVFAASRFERLESGVLKCFKSSLGSKPRSKSLCVFSGLPVPQCFEILNVCRAPRPRSLVTSGVTVHVLGAPRVPNQNMDLTLTLTLDLEFLRVFGAPGAPKLEPSCFRGSQGSLEFFNIF